MATGAVVEIDHLTKRFGGFTAVDDLTFGVEPGRITGFLGPNGAGKTTTLRMALGLVRPTSGSVTIDGRPYHDLADPLGSVGAALEATGFHPGRSGRDHLRVLAATAGIPVSRVDELLELTGIPAFARRRAGSYSMGMRQRLALAAALLGDPRLLVLDEPANGLDPEGIRWLRGFLTQLSREHGTTILVSSHLLPEIAQTADDLVIIARGRLVRQGSMAEIGGAPSSVVRTSDPVALAQALSRVGLESTRDGADGLVVDATDLRAIGDVALAADLPVWELRVQRADLETLFLELTGGDHHEVVT